MRKIYKNGGGGVRIRGNKKGFLPQGGDKSKCLTLRIMEIKMISKTLYEREKKRKIKEKN